MSSQFILRVAGLFWPAVALLSPVAAMAEQAAPLEVAAADLGDATKVETITVTATRVARPAFDVPASVDTRQIDPQNVGVNLSESLENVPGLLARDRQNYAQDTQVSIRGFGARSTFGIRGVRLYLDGIPATQPDGQGQVSHFNLATADRVEILRGPFSALYGNSSGGVIQLFTADGSETPEVYASVSGGSFDTWRTSLGNRGSLGAADYNFGYTDFRTEGFRDHSEAERRSLQGKLDYDFGRAGRVTLLFNDFDSPEAQDPLGLTRAQFDTRPSQAAPQAITFDTRKRAEQTQGGLVYDLDLGSGDALRALAYYGHRDIRQFLAIPAATQANARHSGGVVDLGTDYGGGDLRWTHHGHVAGRPWWIAVGLSYDGLSQARRGYENFVGSTLGVQGRLRRDEDNDVESFDQYLQAGLDLSSRWSLLGGVRRSHIGFESHDHYVAGANGDDSGSRDYSATAPVAGVTFKAADGLNLYGSYGTGFETPTLVELAYSPLASPSGGGLNLDLDAARSRNAELGAKLRLRPGLTAQLALFRADTRHELAIASNTGGRATYTNIDRTRRQGAEVSIEAQPRPWLGWQLAYTYLDAEVRDGYGVCAATPCATPDRRVAAGSALPGVPQGALQSRLSFGLGHGLRAFVTGTYVDSVPVNDTDTESAPSYALADVGASWRLDTAHWRSLLFVRCDNVFDQDYVGSVIVNDGNGRYYEPGPGRSVVAGVNLSWKS